MAEAALEVGLVNRVVPPTECNAIAQGQARKLAAKPLTALMETKRLMKGGQQAAVLARMDEEGAVFGRMLHEPAAREAFAALRRSANPISASFEALARVGKARQAMIMIVDPLAA
jgi:enoyl-CoA hydratase/carnithine racemase